MLRAATRAAALVRRRPRARAPPPFARPALVLVRRVALVVGTRTSAALALAEARWRRRAALLGGGLCHDEDRQREHRDEGAELQAHVLHHRARVGRQLGLLVRVYGE